MVSLLSHIVGVILDHNFSVFIQLCLSGPDRPSALLRSGKTSFFSAAPPPVHVTLMGPGPPAAAVGEEEPRARAGVRSEETRLLEDGARRAVHRGTADDADGIDATAHMFIPPS